uniref:Alpha-2,8-sialyltransferase 8E-like n=1 Tax=Sinocyclocheilus anshuiensis TaxID=1608454 RepID=A0A671PGX2_9TELE
MGYSDPTASRDLLGNRSLCFIFICAFGLVTLLQQILYGKNYIKRVKTSELFERWRNLQVCKWAQNKEQAENFRTSLSRCCNAPSFLFTTKRNTPSGSKLRYEVDTSGILHISPEIFKMFPDDMPYSKSQFKKCAVIGNGGIIKTSKCGREIDAADFVFRCNIPPISDMYSEDVGSKTDLVTVNPSIITERFQKLEKWRKPFYDILRNYENSSVVLPAFYNTRNTDVSFRVKYMLDDFESARGVFFFHPQYLLNYFEMCVLCQNVCFCFGLCDSTHCQFNQ